MSDALFLLSDALHMVNIGYPCSGVPKAIRAGKKEIKRLRAENERLQHGVNVLIEDCKKLEAVVDAARMVEVGMCDADLVIISQPAWFAYSALCKALRALDGES